MYFGATWEFRKWNPVGSQALSRVTSWVPTGCPAGFFREAFCGSVSLGIQKIVRDGVGEFSYGPGYPPPDEE